MENKDLIQLENKIAFDFKNKELLLQALTHRSYLNEHGEWKLDHNERLEFLGDAVLELVVTDHLYRNYPNPEGELTNWRSAIVNTKMLFEIAASLSLNEFILLSKGEERDGGRARQYILANATEALIGAIYLDQGYDSARAFIEKFIITRLPKVIAEKLYRDPKSLFQEEAQEKTSLTPTYEVISESGPDHDKVFEVGVYLDKDLIATGRGASKQEAQQEAAQAALIEKRWT
ncbi:MAG: ribonuclease III [Candidatus Yanofskybacteria bacterium CG10_big_fil_rev_8_21_14_0_10_46_23]|uniref:Ribonuclease 3 n=1 Tax=Candidatus Yanofskybacteria bacterium CG10_big_fil_rev_8_21_14_0_10_46_23 TaxID=1975098 RepID=A0A2H0R3X4_9BACT|nr:MAG: ribonuclease III [Candidatus Yanofskybacteria bacterium CG10_big_fil_rev_8_21_14_0_10_46_23]